MLPASRASTGYTGISSSSTGGPVPLLAFHCSAPPWQQPPKVLIPVPSQGLQPYAYGIASLDIADGGLVALSGLDLHVAAGCHSLRPETNKRCCMTPSGAFFFSLFHYQIHGLSQRQTRLAPLS